MGEPRPVEEDNNGETVVPVVAEEVTIGREQVETGRVRIAKHVHEHEEVVDVPGFTEEVEVERVPIGRILDGPVEARYEGDTLVIPVMEETLVVQKRLLLKEELRVTRRRRETHDPQRVILRREEAQVERLDPEEGSTATHHDPAGQPAKPHSQGGL